MKKIIQPISILLIITLLSAICTIPYAATIVNGSNYEFTVMDATKVQKYVVGMIDLTDDEKFLYDTNGDNVLTVIDATNIQKIIESDLALIRDIVHFLEKKLQKQPIINPLSTFYALMHKSCHKTCKGGYPRDLNLRS